MFTGIITHTAKLRSLSATQFTFEAQSSLCRKLRKGTSIAINGTCLTVVRVPTKTSFCVEVIPETLKRTMLGELAEGNLVNLELPVAPHQMMSGHIVQGHIDGVGTVRKIQKEGNSRILTFSIRSKLSRYLVEKGSVAVNGISLTLIDTRPGTFTVGIIPHTWKRTMLHRVKIGTKVNVETDILAKYMERLLSKE